jgi:hypothetical protein
MHNDKTLRLDSQHVQCLLLPCALTRTCMVLRLRIVPAASFLDLHFCEAARFLQPCREEGRALKTAASTSSVDLYVTALLSVLWTRHRTLPPQCKHEGCRLPRGSDSGSLHIRHNLSVHQSQPSVLSQSELRNVPNPIIMLYQECHQ